MARESKRPNARDAATKRRSPCPVSCSLDIFGDRWSLLIVRDLHLGGHRFTDLLASPEGIPTNILTERLHRLMDHGIISSCPSRPGSTRVTYHLTKKGNSLLPTLRRIRDWGLEWERGTSASLKSLT